ncbi:glutaminyl-peptide cyclotransferase [Corynebacterium sanguinis]|uniref:glutaminyl-peptide cyclotransferase n=1 Tax=Corynebacterium sanguinis TaxID=2594913 RepID=UPI0021A7DB5E|nr:glutaminyl-peptide cyclotransferase [Corynebacterium sanguinis]MCT1444330.1 glutaminyl-peptide cyclotransferase [Corynebacterium sanguinis]
MPRLSLKAAAPLAALLLTPALVSCSSQELKQPREQGVEKLKAVAEERYDFDPSSFTQGLEVADDGTLYVGTGQVGSSRIYRATPDGQIMASRDIDPGFFGEGLTRVDDHLWQLTWQDGVAIKRDAQTLDELGRTTYEGEGWGVCARDGEVILSDGTSQLRRMDPETLAERERFDVTLNGTEVPRLNELECVGDQIFANVFLTTDIVRIDATTGDVTAVIDASSLPNNAAPDPNNVLNGIAHIPGTEEFYLSGKRWPDLYRVSFQPAAVG